VQPVGAPLERPDHTIRRGRCETPFPLMKYL
jgi:hypothetical protein